MPRASLRALVVDDNAVHRQLLSAILRSQNVEVEIAVNGAIGVEAARQTAFDLILMDLNMPVMDGHMATELIRRSEADRRGRKARILIVSPQDAPDDLARSQAAGADQHITKPVNLAGLVGLIQDCRRAALAEACLRWVQGRLSRAVRRATAVAGQG